MESTTTTTTTTESEGKRTLGSDAFPAGKRDSSDAPARTLPAWLWRLHDGLDALKKDCLGHSAASWICEDPGFPLQSAAIAWLLRHFAARRDKDSLMRFLEGWLSGAARLYCAAVAEDNQSASGSTKFAASGVGALIAEHVVCALEGSVAGDEESDPGDSSEPEEGEPGEDDGSRLLSDDSRPLSDDDEIREEREDALEPGKSEPDGSSPTPNEPSRTEGDEATPSSSRVGLPPAPTTSAKLWKETLYDDRVANAFRALLEQAAAVGEVACSTRLIRALYDPSDPRSWLEETGECSALARLALAALPENAGLVGCVLREAVDETRVVPESRSLGAEWRATATTQVLRAFWRATLWPRTSSNDGSLARACLQGGFKTKARLLDGAVVDVWESSPSVRKEGEEDDFWKGVLDSCALGNSEMAERVESGCREIGCDRSLALDRPLFERIFALAGKRAPVGLERVGSIARLWALFPAWPAADTRGFLLECVDLALRASDKRIGSETLATLVAGSESRAGFQTLARAIDSLDFSAAFDVFFFGCEWMSPAYLFTDVVKSAAKLRDRDGGSRGVVAQNLRRAHRRQVGADLVAGLVAVDYASRGRLFADVLENSSLFNAGSARSVGDPFEIALAEEIAIHLSSNATADEALAIVDSTARLMDGDARAKIFFAVPWRRFLPSPAETEAFGYVACLRNLAKLLFLLICADSDSPDSGSNEPRYFETLFPLTTAPLRASLIADSGPSWNLDAVCKAFSQGLVHGEDETDVPGAAPTVLGIGENGGWVALEVVDSRSDDSDGSDDSWRSDGPGESATGETEARNLGSTVPYSTRANTKWRMLLEEHGEDFANTVATRFAPDSADVEQWGVPPDCAARCRLAFDRAIAPGFADRFLAIAVVYLSLPDNSDVRRFEDEEEESYSTPPKPSACGSEEFWKYWHEATLADDDEPIEGLVWRPIVSRVLRFNFSPETLRPGGRRRSRRPPFDSIGGCPAEWLTRCAAELDRAIRALEVAESGDVSPATSTGSTVSIAEFASPGETSSHDERPWRTRLENFFPGLGRSRARLFQSLRIGSEESWKAILRTTAPSTPAAATAESLLWPIELVANLWDPKGLAEAGLVFDCDSVDASGNGSDSRQAIAFAFAFSERVDWVGADSSPAVRAMWEDSVEGPFGWSPFGAICALVPSTEFAGWSDWYPFYRTLVKQFAFFARRAGGCGWWTRLADDFEGRTSPEQIDALALEAVRAKTEDAPRKRRELDFLRARRIVAGLAARRDRFLLPMIADSVRRSMASLPFQDPTCANCQEPLTPGEAVAFYRCDHAVHVGCLCNEIQHLDPDSSSEQRRCAYRCDAVLDFDRKHVRLDK